MLNMLKTYQFCGYLHISHDNMHLMYKKIHQVLPSFHEIEGSSLIRGIAGIRISLGVSYICC